MRAVLLLLPLWITSAVALPKAGKEPEPAPPRFVSVIEHLSNPVLESLVQPADELTSQPDMSNCEHFVFRVKMQLPQNITYDNALNELISMVSPGERKFEFGVMSQQKSSGIATMGNPNLTDSTRQKLESLNNKALQVLVSNSQVILMGGTAVYTKAKTVDAVMTVRALVDLQASEFLIFGSGQCR